MKWKIVKITSVSPLATRQVYRINFFINSRLNDFIVDFMSLELNSFSSSPLMRFAFFLLPPPPTSSLVNSIKREGRKMKRENWCWWQNVTKQHNRSFFFHFPPSLHFMVVRHREHDDFIDQEGDESKDCWDYWQFSHFFKTHNACYYCVCSLSLHTMLFLHVMLQSHLGFVVMFNECNLYSSEFFEFTLRFLSCFHMMEWG